MLHYQVWFNLKPGIAESDGISRIELFLRQLLAVGRISGFRLLKNASAPPKTVLAQYDALIEFSDEQQFAVIFEETRRIGIHTEPHGGIAKIVGHFSADVFKAIP
jgi:hypothetical protein